MAAAASKPAEAAAAPKPTEAALAKPAVAAPGAESSLIGTQIPDVKIDNKFGSIGDINLRLHCAGKKVTTTSAYGALVYCK